MFKNEAITPIESVENKTLTEKPENEEPVKEKKKRKESLLFKYGIIAFFEILAIVSVFLIYITRNIKAPIKSIYDESIENFLDSAVDNVKSWFENQIIVMNTFQRAVVDATDNPESIKHRIKTVPKPEGYEYVIGPAAPARSGEVIGKGLYCKNYKEIAEREFRNKIIATTK